MESWQGLFLTNYTPCKRKGLILAGSMYSKEVLFASTGTLTYKMQGAKELTQGFPDAFGAWFKVNTFHHLGREVIFWFVLVFFFRSFFFSSPFAASSVQSQSK